MKVSVIALAICLPTFAQAADRHGLDTGSAEFKLEQIRAIIEGYSIPVLDPHAGDFGVPVRPSRIDDVGDPNPGMTGGDSLYRYRGLLEKDRMENRSVRPRR